MSVEEAAARALAAQAVIRAALQAEDERREAVRELRAAGWSHAQVAALLGVTRSRAAQIAR